MKYTTFKTEKNNQLIEPMFFGNPVNVARFDQQKHICFEKLTEKQLSFYWRPEEVDVTRDKIDFDGFTDSEKHIFISNLKYQTLLDSVQGRSPNVAFLPIVSIPELENFIETWSFFETIHSRSYTHIIRAIFNEPNEIFEDIVENEEIQKRAVDIAKYYDDLIFLTQLYQTQGLGEHEVDGEVYVVTLRELKKKLYLCMCSVNALEAIRFYVSFACTFSFAERDTMEGSCKLVKLIARDENVHLSATQSILNLWREGNDDPEMAEIAKELEPQAFNIFMEAVHQEKQWAAYLFKDGSVIGLNEEILCQYVEYIANRRMEAIGLIKPFTQEANPIPWINHWLSSDNVQVAPQEAEISSYLVGQINSEIDSDDLGKFEL